MQSYNPSKRFRGSSRPPGRPAMPRLRPAAPSARSHYFLPRQESLLAVNCDDVVSLFESIDAHVESQQPVRQDEHQQQYYYSETTMAGMSALAAAAARRADDVWSIPFDSPPPTLSSRDDMYPDSDPHFSTHAAAGIVEIESYCFLPFPQQPLTYGSILIEADQQQMYCASTAEMLRPPVLRSFKKRRSEEASQLEKYLTQEPTNVAGRTTIQVPRMDPSAAETMGTTRNSVFSPPSAVPTQTPLVHGARGARDHDSFFTAASDHYPGGEPLSAKLVGVQEFAYGSLPHPSPRRVSFPPTENCAELFRPMSEQEDPEIGMTSLSEFPPPSLLTPAAENRWEFPAFAHHGSLFCTPRVSGYHPNMGCGPPVLMDHTNCVVVNDDAMIVPVPLPILRPFANQAPHGGLPVLDNNYVVAHHALIAGQHSNHLNAESSFVAVTPGFHPPAMSLMNNSTLYPHPQRTRGLSPPMLSGQVPAPHVPSFADVYFVPIQELSSDDVDEAHFTTDQA